MYSIKNDSLTPFPAFVRSEPLVRHLEILAYRDLYHKVTFAPPNYIRLHMKSMKRYRIGIVVSSQYVERVGA